MNIACLVTPALGHWHPVAALLLAAQSDGHEVRVLSADSFLPTIRSAGFIAAPCGKNWTGTQAQTTLPELLQANTIREHFEIFYRLLAPEMYLDAFEYLAQWSPDAIVHDALSLLGH